MDVNDLMEARDALKAIGLSGTGSYASTEATMKKYGLKVIKQFKVGNRRTMLVDRNAVLIAKEKLASKRDGTTKNGPPLHHANLLSIQKQLDDITRKLDYILGELGLDVSKKPEADSSLDEMSKILNGAEE